MKNISLFLLMSISMILLTTCVSKEKETAIPGSVGKISEMIVVANKPVWEGVLGDTVKEYFGRPYPWLNQMEPLFDIVTVEHNDLNKTLRKHRNILLFVVDKNIQIPKVTKENDKWSSPQTVIEVVANTVDGLIEIFVERKEEINRLFCESEIVRLKKIWVEQRDIKQSEEIESFLNINVVVPKGYWIAGKKGRTVWVRKQLKHLDQETGFTITEIPYTDTNQFNLQEILSLRDSILKINVPVQTAEAYMGTEYEFMPESQIMELDKKFAVETRGFWKSINSFMGGGPFINYMIHDSKQDRLIMFDAYVFRPNEEKRDLIRQMESLAHTISFE